MPLEPMKTQTIAMRRPDGALGNVNASDVEKFKSDGWRLDDGSDAPSTEGDGSGDRAAMFAGYTVDQLRGMHAEAVAGGMDDVSASSWAKADWIDAMVASDFDPEG